MLSKEPAKIRLGDIVRALEGPIAPVDCVAEEPGGEVCERMATCVTRRAWLQLRDAMTKVLDNITLEDLSQEATAMRKNEDNYMYYI